MGVLICISFSFSLTLAIYFIYLLVKQHKRKRSLGTGWHNYDDEYISIHCKVVIIGFALLLSSAITIDIIRQYMLIRYIESLRLI